MTEETRHVVFGSNQVTVDFNDESIIKGPTFVKNEAKPLKVHPSETDLLRQYQVEVERAERKAREEALAEAARKPDEVIF